MSFIDELIREMNICPEHFGYNHVSFQRFGICVEIYTGRGMLYYYEMKYGVFLTLKEKIKFYFALKKWRKEHRRIASKHNRRRLEEEVWPSYT